MVGLLQRAWDAIPHRWVRSTTYLIFIGAGLVSLAAPSRVLEAELGHSWTLAWGIYLAAGGVLCLAGSATDRWLGEFAGLPLIGSAIFVYAAIILSTVTEATWRLPPGLILMAFDVLLLDRWLDVRAISIASQRAHTPHRRE